MRQIETLQGLRGAAILIIMLSHYADHLHFLGSIGNSIFMVLSGFLAIYTYRPSTEPLWKEMAGRYWRKARKTYVPFLIATILAIPLSLHILNDAWMVPKIVVYLLQLQAWVLDYTGYGWLILVGPSWFLGTYLFCECLVPVLVPLVRRLGERHLEWIGIAAVAIILILVNANCVWQVSSYYPPVRLCDFVMGMMGGSIAVRAGERLAGRWETAGAVALVLTILAILGQSYIPGVLTRNVLWSVLTVILLIGLYCAEQRQGGMLYAIYASRPLTFVGSISMELFLFHAPIGSYIRVVDNHLLGGGYRWIAVGLSIMVSIVFCMIYHRLRGRVVNTR